MLSFIQGWEWVIILLAVLLLFGAKKLPELAKGLGKGIREFKKASSEISYEMDRESERQDYEREQARHGGPARARNLGAPIPGPSRS